MADELGPIIQTLTGMAENAAKPEKSEPGPGDVGPTIETKVKGPLVTLQMDEPELQKWFARIDKARARVDAACIIWDILLEEYLPIVKKSGVAETVKVNRHFRDVHTKMGQLFYKSPDLVLSPNDPGPGQNSMPNPMNQPGQPPLPDLKLEDIVAVKQALLTKRLGRDGIKANRLMDELLFDNLAWAPFGCSKLGYRCVTKPYNKPVMVPDPNFIPQPPPPGTMLGLQAPQPAPLVQKMGPDGKGVTEAIPVPIFEEVYWRRFSPKKLLFNDDLRSTRFDEDATWEGMDFYMSPEQAQLPVERGGFGLSPEECSGLESDDRVHKFQGEELEQTQGLLHFVEIFCKASRFTDEVHPQAMNQLIVLKGLMTRPVVWRPSPDQTFDEMGKLTVDSLINFPYRILTIRDLADSPFPPSDAAFTNSGIKQLSTFLRQRVKQRDANIGKFLYDSDILDDDTVDALEKAEVGSYNAVKPGSLDKGIDKVCVQTAQVKSTPDDVRTEELLRRDLDETLGIGSTQSGAMEKTVHSATEVHEVNRAVTARNDKELGRAVDFYLDGARMVDTLLMRYATNDEYVEVAGEEGARRMQMWNKEMISGKYLYDIAPDSQLRADTGMEIQRAINTYNLMAKDPLFNRIYAIKKIARSLGWDPAKATLPPQPPKSGPDVSVGFSFKGEDLMVVGGVPLNPAAYAILLKAGILPEGLTGAPGAPPTLPQATPGRPPQPPHGGPSPQGDQGGAGEAVNQHTASNSGGRPNQPGSENHREMQVK